MLFGEWDYLSFIAVIGTLAAGWLLANRRLVRSAQWRATVTPLASIIGSGFLVVAPLLHSVLGKWALAGMTVLSLFAYAVGKVIRFNIRHAEAYLDQHPASVLARLEGGAQWVLGAAYAISVAFYTSLLVAFVFDRFGLDGDLASRQATTVLLLVIMGVAWWRGAKGLETIELVAVTIKLAIIVGVLIALAGFDIASGAPWFQHEPLQPLSLFETLAMVAGMLMVTQGFETARFTGESYDRRMRVNAVRYSQWLAIAIYVLFIGLTCPIFLTFPIVELTETTISRTLGQAVGALPFLLLIAATASQLSAALADTIGGGGLLRERVPRKLPANLYYLIVVGVAGILIWTSDVFEIINYASKGFAAFFLIQVLIALILLGRLPRGTGTRWGMAGCWFLLIGLGFVVFWSIPAPHE